MSASTRPAARKGRPPLHDHGEWHRLYLLGLTDGEIAKRTGADRTSVVRYRKGQNLAANAPRGHRLSRGQLAARMKLYQQGLTDSEIAQRLRITAGKIRDWRRSRGLKVNRRKPAPRHRTLSTAQSEANGAFMALYALKLCDEQIAAELGISTNAVLKRRERRNLPAHTRPPFITSAIVDGTASSTAASATEGSS